MCSAPAAGGFASLSTMVRELHVHRAGPDARHAARPSTVRSPRDAHAPSRSSQPHHPQAQPQLILWVSKCANHLLLRAPEMRRPSGGASRTIGTLATGNPPPTRHTGSNMRGPRRGKTSVVDGGTGGVKRVTSTTRTRAAGVTGRSRRGWRIHRPPEGVHGE